MKILKNIIRLSTVKEILEEETKVDDV